MEKNAFFTLLTEKLIGLGLTEREARAELSVFASKMSNNLKFESFVERAGDTDAARLAERIYAAAIVRANTMHDRNEDTFFAGNNTQEIFSLTLSDYDTKEGTLQNIPAGSGVPHADGDLDDEGIEANQKPDYVGVLCEKISSDIKHHPWHRLLLILIVSLCVIATAIIIVLFLAAFAALICVSLFFLLLTCGVAVGGTASALAGIIYGIIQFFSDAAPIGWYEIGIAITIIGMSMFAGITFYNFAVRLIPIVIKLLAGEFRRFFKRLSGDYKTAKGVFVTK